MSARGLPAPRSDCPIAGTLDLIGDRWTLVIVRDLMMGKRRFSEFLVSGEGIKTNILADRLKRLERAGLVERSRYQVGPPRYEYRLTRSGRDLGPVLRAVFSWGRAHLPAARGRRSTGSKRVGT
ncbi:MAG TPA: helix-turn-helix domain-containing protein [Gemmatimonadales bacterium]|nr:helix-turn-helix domain-containing protein [Gemmatimonadales bacterium]